MNVRTLSAMFAGLLLVDCSPPSSLTFDVDAAFAPATRDVILHQMDLWCEYTVPDSCPTIDGGDWRIVRGRADGPCAVANGCTQLEHHLVWIDDVYSPEVTAMIARHELGHAIGLAHICQAPPPAHGETAPGAPPCDPAHAMGVMDPIHVYEGTFSGADLAECRRVGSCREE